MHQSEQFDQSGTGLDPESITFLNWNLYKGNGKDWRQDLAAFARDHHVMAIQEALLDDDLNSLLHQHELNWVMNTAFRMNGAAAGVMNVSRASAIYSCGFKNPEPVIRVPKSTLVSYYGIAGFDKTLLVANIHGINFTLGVSSYRKQLDQLYHAVKSHQGPMIVAGDFNSWSSSRMVVVQQLLSRLGLSELEYPVNNKTHVFGNAIDHVFYRDLEPLQHAVHEVSSSDHNPISVTFSFQETTVL